MFIQTFVVFVFGSTMLVQLGKNFNFIVVCRTYGGIFCTHCLNSSLKREKYNIFTAFIWCNTWDLFSEFNIFYAGVNGPK